MAPRSPTPAVASLVAGAVPHRLHRYTHDPAVASYGLEAAEHLGVDPRRVHKTLVADVDGGLVVAVTSVASDLDLKALATTVGAKRASLADRAAAERATGYVVGGISPFGQRRALTTVLDEGALGWPTVFVSGGRRGLEIELAPHDLAAVTGALVAAIAAPG